MPFPKLVGGHIALDFANTIDDRQSAPNSGDHPTDCLTDYAAWVRWNHYASSLADGQMAALLALAERRPEQAMRAFQTAIALRETLYRLFSAVAGRRPLPPDDLARFNQQLALALPQLQLLPQAETLGCALGWDANLTLERPLHMVLWAAAELLTDSRLHRLRECEADDCTWLFLDTTRNHSRHWCDMAECGNRAKARRFYQKTRKG